MAVSGGDEGVSAMSAGGRNSEASAAMDGSAQNNDAIPTSNAPAIANDLLSGAKAIAAFLGLPVRKVFHLVETGGLPAFRLGAGIHARKSTLRQFIADREAAAIDKGRAA